MIKSEQVPDEVVEALTATLHGKPGLPYREALAAALNAWPGMRMMVDIDTGDDAAIKLPLPEQENSDE